MMDSTNCRLTLAILVLLPALAGCATQSKEVLLLPVSLTAEPVFDSEPQPAETQAREATTPQQGEIPQATPAPSVDDKVDSRSRVVLIEGEQEEEPVTSRRLLAASREEKLRRANTEPVAVITDKNLKESGEGGQLTLATSSPTPPDGDAPTADPTVADEELWRSRALDLRLSWKKAIDETLDLQEEVDGLRRRFYAEDDPFYRDNEIKPAWDRALEDLARVRSKAEGYQSRLDLFLEEGRRAGALPGWLREGLEYEPASDHPARRRDDPNEPEVVDEDNWIEP